MRTNLSILFFFAALVPLLGYSQSRIEAFGEPPLSYFRITAFGATGDAKTLNTRAIQEAIDAAEAAGGGVVVVPEGRFLTGSIFLKPGVELQLEKGGVLLGSQDIEDYPVQMTRIEGKAQPWRMALVNARGVDGLRIYGEGELNGNGAPFWAAFWQRRRENPACTNLEVERPRILYVERCNDVWIRGVKLRDSGFWNLHVYRCQDVTIEGLDIEAPDGPPPNRAPSSDGIDIDSCQWVTVKGCRISVGDDSIALKGTKGIHALDDESSPPVHHILIEDCVYDGGHGVATMGSEATVVRDVTVRNCVVNGDNSLVRLKLRPDTPQTYENLLFENIELNGVGRIFNVNSWTQFLDLQGHEPPASVVRNVTLRNIKGRFGSMGSLVGNPNDVITGITLESIDLKLEKEVLQMGPVEKLAVRNVVINGKLFTTD